MLEQNGVGRYVEMVQPHRAGRHRETIVIEYAKGGPPLRATDQLQTGAPASRGEAPTSTGWRTGCGQAKSDRAKKRARSDDRGRDGSDLPATRAIMGQAPGTAFRAPTLHP
ncbi:hypothetical protein GCM10020219_060980 [Nonomuraea dietziae]